MSELYLGLMSGTSMDGLDLALVAINDPFQAELLHFDHLGYDHQTSRDLVAWVQKGEVSLAQWVALNHALGDFFARGVNRFLKKLGVAKQDVKAIGMHGVTVWHGPEPVDTPLGPGVGTLQLGDPHLVAVRTGIPVVFDFRHADMALGGQGAPLAPFIDHHYFRSADTGRVLLNLGGIANMTFLPAGSQGILAFDSGPSNMIMDNLMRDHLSHPQSFDPEGQFAAQGKVIPELLQRCLAHSYFSRKPPKSTGRELFGQEFTDLFLQWKHEDYNDLLATAAMFTAQTVADAIHNIHMPPHDAAHFKELIVSGGGPHNHTLMRLLAEKLPEMTITKASQHGIHEDAKEAVLMAALAWAHERRIPGNFPSVTGASEPIVLGARIEVN